MTWTVPPWRGSEPERDVVRVCPIGELDIGTVDQVRAQLVELRSSGFSRLILDLRRTTFLGLCRSSTPAPRTSDPRMRRLVGRSEKHANTSLAMRKPPLQIDVGQFWTRG